MRNNLALLGFIFLKFVIQYMLIGPEYELHRDEFLHLDQANHLAWGYTSVPPVTSWISYLIQLLGNSVFWIKFFPALFGALTILVVWRTIEALQGNLLALLLGASCITFSVLFRLNILYQPNSLDVLCWTTFYYFYIKYLQDREAKWLYALAVIFALGFLNKYNIAFALLGIIPAVVVSREWKIFKDRKLYYSIAIAFVLILPNLVWQYTHGFPVFHHMKELSETHLVHVNRWNFLRSQFLFFPATFPVILLGLFALIRYAPFAKYRSLFWSFIFTLAIFLFFKAKDYYAIGLYPIYLAFGSVYISSLLPSRSGRLVQIGLIVFAAVCFLPIYDIAYPNKSPEYIVNHADKYSKFGLLTWEDGKEHHLPQDFADMLGWKELANTVDSMYSTMPNADNTLILCDHYGQAAAINFYSKLGLKAVSFNADYLYWFDFSIPYDNFIRIKNGWESDQEMAKTSPYFERSIKVGSITNAHAREYGTVILSFIGAKIDLNRQIEKEVTMHQRREK